MKLNMLLLVLLFVLGAAGLSPASMITFTNTGLDLHGQGFGAAPPVLTIKQHGNADVESGQVYWNGSKDVLVDDADKNKCETVTVGSLLDSGVTQNSFGLLLNINEPGSADQITIYKFSADFYTPSGSLILSAPFDAEPNGLTLAGFDHGQGKSGWLFQIDLTPAEFNLVISDPNNRMGMTVPSDNPFTGVAGGAEDFRSGIPEPSTIILLLLGGAVIQARRAKARTRVVQ